ncbi:pentapeptide repeat-containing protein [Nocardioides solisilvae]|uniref:pentapeptide repeat-containing protein n=1 Tax=Nocardioides solisilvae TaxID=1542435 RepID=UPI000D748ECC|nr:pentapeptide repeat-containing protein [Nocardioides solisilvae]
MKPLELVADCGRCTGLCCVLLPFRADSGFGTDKAGGDPCHHLAADDRCGIHSVLRASGWPGCTVFDCFGAGQHLTEHTYAGRSWRDPGANRAEMGAVLSVLRLLHEAAAHLDEAVRRDPAPRDAATLLGEVTERAGGIPDELLALDLDDLMPRVSAALRAASSRVRGDGRPSYARADLAGRDLRRDDLRGADLHGSTLIAADLRGVDLDDADLLGADVRDADVRGSDLSRALFLTRPQVAAMRGDGGTRLPAGMPAPGHWPAGDRGGGAAGRRGAAQE